MCYTLMELNHAGVKQYFLIKYYRSLDSPIHTIIKRVAHTCPMSGEAVSAAENQAGMLRNKNSQW